MKPLLALEVEIQLLTTSRSRWKEVATTLYNALSFRLSNVEQTTHHNNAKTAYLTLLSDEKSTFPSPLPPQGGEVRPL